MARIAAVAVMVMLGGQAGGFPAPNPSTEMPPEQLIVGRWQVKEAQAEFTADGRMLTAQAGFAGANAKYSLAAGVLELEYGNGVRLGFRVLSLKSDKLVLGNADGKVVNVLRRLDDGR